MPRQLLWHRDKPPLGFQLDVCSPFAKGLVGCWVLNETEGMSVFDLSPYGYNGVLNATGVSWVSAQNGTALSFDGSTGNVNLGNPAKLQLTGDMTIVAGCNVIDYANLNGILAKTHTSVAASWDFYLTQTTGKPRLYRGNGTTSANFEATAAPGVGVFHQIAVTQTGTTAIHYLDALINGSGALSTTQTDQSDNVYIGSRSDSGTLFKGTIYYVYIWNRALSYAEIRNIYTAPYQLFQPMKRTSIARPGTANTYVNTAAKKCENRVDALTEIWNQLTNAGWVLVDNKDASSYRIYSSNGALGDRIPEYVKIDWITANTITITACYYWNAVSHTSFGLPWGNDVLTTQETPFYLWIYGDKNLFYIVTKCSTTYKNLVFGHLPKKMYPTPDTYLTQAAYSGGSVTINVDSTDGFCPNRNYQIMGNFGEGRDTVTVSSITDSTHMVITTLLRKYGIRSKIGSNPSTFGNSRNYSGTQYPITCPYNVVGTGNTSDTELIYPSLQVAEMNPDNQLNGNPLSTWYVCGNGTLAHFGYCDSNILYAVGATASEDIFTVGEQVWGTSSGSNDGTHLNDTTKTWTTNAWQNKVLVITGGIGVGQTRVIASNTTTQITINTAWTTIPDATSIYIVCDEAYRAFIGNAVFCCKEVI